MLHLKGKIKRPVHINRILNSLEKREVLFISLLLLCVIIWFVLNMVRYVI